jgi:biopolymer transport protein TolR
VRPLSNWSRRHARLRETLRGHMTGSTSVPGAPWGRKLLNSELNLVPFIDLLSCLISFLLITAVWTQTSKVHAQTTGSLASNEPTPEAAIRLVLTGTGFALTMEGVSSEILRTHPAPLSTTPGGYDLKALSERLSEVKTRLPDQHSITVAAEDGVSFEDLAATIDAVAGPAIDLPDVSITPS